ncbi:threonine synthase [Paenibacillus radicis (ex Xue et al. 2023)]|uniref:Threonine synthase n=1 Tax=Paenibacillus radicis (ex Xue et al. 2023) TaxID=2972489 RepID=A0ABT1YBA8_9BACL|nr:threonine synthase [Paenibacillus radicis (ex Xue et al. 2023)]MCR8630467.1 threonine synthase [Paenibacillus radicis (ex Xue et al. 2023)]
MRFWLECRKCGKQISFHINAGACSCGGALRVEYDLELVKHTLSKESLNNRIASMWRYAELLPIEKTENIITMGEGFTPLVPLTKAEQALPLGKLWVKREEQNPTGSFKARGFSVALSIANEYGIHKVAVNSNGNAASALAAYAGFAGMEAYVFLPKDCPWLIIEECLHYGAHTYLVDGLIQDAGKLIREGEQEQKWYNVGTMKEPGRAEGKKTMGLEIAEQLHWKLPEVIIYPTGGGSGVIGMWNAFQQLKQLGFIQGDLPRIVCIQETGCQPIVTALQNNDLFSPQSEDVNSSPTGMRVPYPPDGQLLVSIIRQSGGTALAVSQEEIRQAQLSLGKLGISSSPEGAATWAGLIRLLDQGGISRYNEVVLFNTSHAMKYRQFSHRTLPVVKSYKEWVGLNPS